MSLTPINLGDGQAPDVTIVDGLIYVAVPLRNGIQLDVFNALGARVRTHPIADGFFSSFPRFDREWLVYKSYPSFAPVVLNVRTNETRTFAGRVDGNLGAFVDANSERAFWQTAMPDGLLHIFTGSLLTGEVTQTGLVGAPDGIERLNADGSVLCWKDIMLADPAVGGYPSHAGDLTVGQYGYGIGVRLGAGPVRWLLGGSETMWPRCAAAAGTYAVVSWGNVGVRLVIASGAELLALPLTPTENTPDPVKPPPVDPVKPTEPFSMRLPDKVQRIVDALYAQHKALADGDDDQRRSLAGMIAEQARFEMGPDWGWKRAGEGRPPSKDAIAFKGGPELIGWDLFNGSTRAPNRNPESMSLAGQIFIDVAPINHLGNVSVPPPPPADPVDPPPSGDISALILAELRKLSAHLGVR